MASYTTSIMCPSRARLYSSLICLLPLISNIGVETAFQSLTYCNHKDQLDTLCYELRLEVQGYCNHKDQLDTLCYGLRLEVQEVRKSTRPPKFTRQTCTLVNFGPKPAPILSRRRGRTFSLPHHTSLQITKLIQLC
jgi:hypothetical protein